MNSRPIKKFAFQKAASDANRRLVGRGAKHDQRSRLAVVLFLVFFFLPSTVQTADRDPIDEQLFKELNEKTSDDVDRELFGPAAEKKPSAEQDEGEAAWEEKLRRELGAAAEKEDDSPLLNVVRKMLLVQDRVAQADAGPATQAEQNQIVEELDRLIQEAKKHCRACSSSSSKPGQSSKRTPGGPPKAKTGESSTARKPGQQPSPQDRLRLANNGQKPAKLNPQQIRTALEQHWGELPPNVREQMLQMATEEFMPKYQEMLEQYYRRLAEEKEE